MTENPYAPGVYVKGDDERVADSSRDAVALVFAGFAPKVDEPVAEEKPAETETPTPAPSPRALATRKSQEDNQS